MNGSRDTPNTAKVHPSLPKIITTKDHPPLPKARQGPLALGIQGRGRGGGGGGGRTTACDSDAARGTLGMRPRGLGRAGPHGQCGRRRRPPDGFPSPAGGSAAPRRSLRAACECGATRGAEDGIRRGPGGCSDPGFGQAGPGRRRLLAGPRAPKGPAGRPQPQRGGRQPPPCPLKVHV